MLTDFVSRSRLRAVIWPVLTPANISGRQWFISNYSILVVICIHLVSMYNNSGIWFNIYGTKSVGVGSESTTDSAALWHNHKLWPGILPSRLNWRSRDRVPDIVPKLSQHEYRNRPKWKLASLGTAAYTSQPCTLTWHWYSRSNSGSKDGVLDITPKSRQGAY